MTNPVWGLCPRCQIYENSTFMQSIHSDVLFRKLAVGYKLQRHWLFCTPCITWARAEILKARDKRLLQQQQQQQQYSPISEPSGSRSPPVQYVMPLPQPSTSQSQVRQTSTVQSPMMALSDVIGSRLAGHTTSPVHLAHSTLPYYLTTESRPPEPLILNREPLYVPPLPSPLLEDADDVWKMDDYQVEGEKESINEPDE